MIHTSSGKINLSDETLGTGRKLPDDPLSVSLRELREAAEPFNKALFDLRFSTFYEQAQSLVRGLVRGSVWGPEYSNLRDDICQELFLKFSNPLIVLQYNPTRAAQPWMRRAARNLVIDYIRRSQSALRKASTFTSLDLPEEFTIKGGFQASLVDKHGDEPAQIAINSESSKALRKLIDRTLAALPPRDREIWLLREQKIPYGEISDRLNMHLGTVKSALNRIKGQLRDAIDKTSLAAETTDNSSKGDTHLFTQLKGPARPGRLRSLAS